MKQKKTVILFLLASAVLLSSCSPFPNRSGALEEKVDVEKDHSVQEAVEEKASLINPSGNTLETRILTPEGFSRTEAESGSLTEFLRNYEMKPDGSPVLLYNGRKKFTQDDHVAVFSLPIENEDLQQCADSIMRVYGEYYYSRGEYEKIVFTLGGNFKADFSKWMQGNGIKLSGDNLVWTSAPGNDSSYDSFKRFMRIVFAYSGTLNMVDDSTPIKEADIQVGDIFIKGGSPGHVVMVVDMCQNENGEKAFLLAQGYMPAQEFHVLKNPEHEDDPWYYVNEIKYPFHTPEYTFEEGSLMRYRLSQ